MSKAKRRQAEHNAGAFYGPDGYGMIPVPMNTLSDEYRDVPVEPEDDHVPEPEPPGLVQRVIDRVKGHADQGH